ncbi:MAG: NFACT RNA binding domain-containing protein [Nanoarchaeota archaeon]
MNTKKFREQVLSSGILALAGRNAENNEELVKQVGNNEYVLHTAAPGSPFVNIKTDSKDVSKEDLKEAAIFCAKYSQAWKKATVKKDVEVHVFLGKDIFKQKDMKLGTFGVKKFKTIVVKKNEIV